MTRSIMAAAAVSCALLAACQKAEAPAAPAAAAITEADASKAFDDTVAVWQSMDAAKVKALYAPDVVGFDVVYAPMVTDRATWDKNQDAFAGAKLDSIKVTAKKIQILDGDNFVVSSWSDGTSTATPKNNGSFRCTDVFHRDAGGAWTIVNENCSAPPKAA